MTNIKFQSVEMNFLIDNKLLLSLYFTAVWRTHVAGEGLIT